MNETCKECGGEIFRMRNCRNPHCQNGRVVVNNTFANYEYEWCPTCKGWGYESSCLESVCTANYTMDYPSNPATEEIKWVEVGL